MTTSYTEIYDLFTMVIRDYKLDELYSSSVIDFNTYLSGWLALAVNDFKNCKQSLVRDDTTFTFVETLSEKTKIMLANLMVKYWLTKEVQDVLQFTLHLNDRDFKTYAESQNLDKKSLHLDKVREFCSQELVDYSYDNTDWAAWGNGVFYVP